MKPYAIALATLLASAFGLLSPRTVAAQELVPGLRIRSKAGPNDKWRTGALVRFGRDSLVMQRCAKCATETQSWNSITRVDVSEGTTWSGKHIAIGALAGGLAAGFIHERKVARDVARCRDGLCGLEGLETPIIGLLGAVGGTVLGALWRVESWREIYSAEPGRD